MKKQILSIIATLTLVVPMSIIGFAGLTTRVKADIPFDFTVGNKEFKAGSYTVSRLYNTATSGTLVIRSADNKAAANFNVNGVLDKGQPSAKLIFHRYGNQYFLARIFDGTSNEGGELLKSKAEREAAKKRDIITQNVVEPETVTVVAQVGR